MIHATSIHPVSLDCDVLCIDSHVPIRLRALGLVVKLDVGTVGVYHGGTNFNFPNFNIIITHTHTT